MERETVLVVLSPAGDTLATLSLPSSATVARAKAEYAEHCGTPVGLLNFAHGTRLLADGDSLGELPSPAALTLLRAAMVTYKVPGDYASVEEAVDHLPECGGRVRVGPGAEVRGGTLLVNKPHVLLCGTPEGVPQRLRCMIVVLKAGHNFQMQNLECNFLNDPFGNFVQDRGQVLAANPVPKEPMSEVLARSGLPPAAGRRLGGGGRGPGHWYQLRDLNAGTGSRRHLSELDNRQVRVKRKLEQINYCWIRITLSVDIVQDILRCLNIFLRQIKMEIIILSWRWYRFINEWYKDILIFLDVTLGGGSGSCSECWLRS